MNWFRGALGYNTQQTNSNKTISAAEQADRSYKLHQAQKLQAAAIADELADVELEIDENIKRGDRVGAKRMLVRKQTLQKDLEVIHGKLANHDQIARSLATAQTNQEQAVLMRSDANSLEQIVEDTEKIDLDDIVDTIQDGAYRTNEFSNRLSEPIIRNAEAEDEVNNELDALMQRAADERLVSAPSVKPESAAVRQRPVKDGKTIKL